jgi:hypothetical protein
MFDGGIYAKTALGSDAWVEHQMEHSKKQTYELIENII